MPDILIVDDSKVMREMIAACLRPDTRLVTSQAASGLEAIERLSLQTFDVLVLDLNMPDIGGLEVVEFVRGQDKLSTLPILIVTTRDEDDSSTKVLAAGATRYMTKPFAPEAILASVQSLLESKHPQSQSQSQSHSHQPQRGKSAGEVGERVVDDDDDDDGAGRRSPPPIIGAG